VSKIVRAQSLRGLFRPLVVTSFGAATVGAVVWSAAAMVAMSGTLSSGSGQFLPSPLLYTAEAMRASVSDGHARTGKGPRLLVAVGRPVLASLALSQGTSLRFLEKFRDKAGVTQAGYDAARFELVVAKTEPISAKRANSADNAGSVKSKRLVAKVAAPAPERFAPLPGGSPTQNQTLLCLL
jgi:hypothetical protein